MTDQGAFEEWKAQPLNRLSVSPEKTWHAALAYLRSQGEPVAYRYRDGSSDGKPRWGWAYRTDPLVGADPLYLAPQPAIPDGWLRVIDEEMVATHLGVADPSDDYETAKRKLSELINWHVQVATDPSVNGGYKLVPVEPTEEMLETGEIVKTTFYNDFGGNEHIEIGANSAEAAYRAMLAAAPEPSK